MNDEVRTILRQLLERYGTDLTLNTQQLEGLLRDFCGNHRREINVLVSAARIRIAEDLSNVSGTHVDELTFQRQVNRLYEETGMADEFANWAVSTWAEALGKSVPGHRARPRTPSQEPSSLRNQQQDEPPRINREGGTGPKRLRTFRGHTQRVPTIAFSTDGELLISGSWDNSVKIWNTERGTCEKTLGGHTYSVKSIAVAPDGSLFASGGASTTETVKLFRLPHGGLVHKIVNINSPSQSPATISINGVAFSPDMQRIVTAGRGCRLWRVADGRLETLLGDRQDKVHAVAWSPDGRLVAAGSDTLEVWRVADGQLVHRLEHAKAQVTMIGSMSLKSKVSVNSVAFSPDGLLLATGGSDQTVKLWQLSNGHLLNTLTGHTNQVFSISFSPCGQFLATGGGDRRVTIWRVADGYPLCTFEANGGVDALVYSPDGKRLAVAGTEPEFELWQLYE